MTTTETVSSSTRPPNFIIGGSSASGTSFLSAVLMQHPEVYLPSEMRPEPHFFYKSWEYVKGWDYYLERWFREVPLACSAVGERSSSYLFGGRETALKMRHHLPNLKLVFILRNPVERTWANYRYTVLEGLEDLPFGAALERESERVKASEGIWAEIQPHNYTGRGFYGQQVAEFLEVFDRDQIHLMKSEDLSRDTDRTLHQLLAFLEVPASDWTYSRPSEFTSMNVIDAALQVELRAALGERFDRFIEAIRTGEPIGSLGSSPEEQRLVDRLHGNLRSTKAPMPSSERAFLQDLFKKDIELLKSFVDFDLDDWR